MEHGQLGHHVQLFVVLVQNNVVVHVFHLDQIVETIPMNKEHVEKPIVNVSLVRFTHQQERLLVYDLFLFLGIKETEPGTYPLKGYLAIREGDILCIPQNGSEMAKHMADLVRYKNT
jgi:hypothetical protein